ncbi:AzlC family ABC transporter permease [Desulfamplus magnetovallimortis]|nr:AzlC family ABC transporter permease [Desulfamplus magnetovallimortis]
MQNHELKNQGSSSPFNQFLSGARDTFPLIVGAIPFGIIFGTLAATAGLSFAATMGMSIFVFAGSSQFISVSLVAAGTAWPMIVLTTFVVNLRHMLYGATMVPFYKNLGPVWKAVLAFGLTDETFAVAINRFNQKDESPYKHYYNLGSMIFMYTNWNLCTFIGLTAGRTFPEISKWGLDFAMPATFIGMVIPYLVTRPMWASVITAGVVSIIAGGLPHKLGLMVAAISGVAAGIFCEINTQKRHL